MVNSGHAGEAYGNFQGYGGQYGNIGAVPGYDDWAAANPDLVPYAQQGFDSGRSSANSSAQMSEMMAQWQSMINSQNSSLLATQENARIDAQNAWFQDSNATWDQIVGGRDISGGGVYDSEYTTFRGGQWRSFSHESGIGNEDLTALNRAMDTRDFSGLGTVYDQQGRNVADRMTTGWNAWNEGYGTYRARGEEATNAVDAQINERRTNAALLGVDFELTDDARQTMVNDQFAALWTDEDQAALDSLKDFEDNREGQVAYDYTRGDAANAITDQSGTSTLVTEGGGITPTTQSASLLDDTEGTQLLGA